VPGALRSPPSRTQSRSHFRRIRTDGRSRRSSRAGQHGAGTGHGEQLRFFEHVSNAPLDVIWDLWTTKDGFES
jgi:hypothetical protein